jgi:hypothetical protein
MNRTLQALYDSLVISLQQYTRAKRFLDEQQKWMITEQDPDHPMMKDELERQLVRYIDIYLWSIDPIISTRPELVQKLARLWMEHNVYKMNGTEASEYIDSWL